MATKAAISQFNNQNYNSERTSHFLVPSLHEYEVNLTMWRFMEGEK